jgi:hypothetical protein
MAMIQARLHLLFAGNDDVSRVFAAYHAYSIGASGARADVLDTYRKRISTNTYCIAHVPTDESARARSKQHQPSV